MVRYGPRANNDNIIKETVSVLESFKCIIHSFLELSWHVSEAIVSSFKSISTSRFSTNDVDISVFCNVLVQLRLTMSIFKIYC